MYRQGFSLVSSPETSDAEYLIMPDDGTCSMCWTPGPILYINKSGAWLFNICERCVKQMAELLVDGLES